MSADRLRAAGALADLLAEENAALQRMDFTAAVALLAAKEAALADMIARGGAVPANPPPPAATALARRLAQLAEENRALLERAIATQTRVVGIVARAACPPALQAYGAAGHSRQLGRSTRPAAVTLAARA